MILSAPTVLAILGRELDEFEIAHEYGEPGYGLTYIGETPLVVLGSYWCRCGDPNDLHDRAVHHPRVWAQMEAQGVEFEWHDEWIVAHDKAWRIQPDSYSWEKQVLETDDGYLTPDDSIEDWLYWLVNDPRKCLTAFGPSDLEAVGFVRFNDDEYEAGWHPGQTDDPVKIAAQVNREYPDDDIVFTLDENSQFYTRFSAWHRPAKEWA